MFDVVIFSVFGSLIVTFLYFILFFSPFSAREKGEGLALEMSTWPTYNINLIISLSFTALLCSSCCLAEITWFSGARSLFPLFARDAAPQYLSELRALYHGVGHAVLYGRHTTVCCLNKALVQCSEGAYHLSEAAS